MRAFDRFFDEGRANENFAGFLRIDFSVIDEAGEYLETAEQDLFADEDTALLGAPMRFFVNEFADVRAEFDDPLRLNGGDSAGEKTGGLDDFAGDEPGGLVNCG